MKDFLRIKHRAASAISTWIDGAILVDGMFFCSFFPREKEREREREREKESGKGTKEIANFTEPRSRALADNTACTYVYFAGSSSISEHRSRISDIL